MPACESVRRASCTAAPPSQDVSTLRPRASPREEATTPSAHSRLEVTAVGACSTSTASTPLSSSSTRMASW